MCRFIWDDAIGELDLLQRARSMSIGNVSMCVNYYTVNGASELNGKILFMSGCLHFVPNSQA